MADKGKIQILLPAIKSLVEKATSTSTADSIPEELAMYLLASYDVGSASTLNNDTASWEVFLTVVRTFLRPGM